MRRILVPLSLVSFSFSLWGLHAAPKGAALDLDPRGGDEVLDQVPDPEQDQDPDQDQEGGYKRDIFGRLRKAQKNPFMGAWQLLDLDIDGYPPQGRFEAGILLIADQFLAFELQATWDEFVTGVILDDGYQSFIAEYILEGGNTLLCRTLIGSYIDEDTNVLDFEPRGIEREFEVRLEDDFLLLSWGESDLLTFGRRLPGRWTQKDIFGNQAERTVPEDLFGRRRTETEEGDEDDG